jgi:hypothetical protein
VIQRLFTWAPLLACLIFGLLTGGGVSMERALGWDEAMHAQLPAARMALALDAGEPGAAIDVALECHQYPFVYPAVLAAVYTVADVDEGLGREVGRWIWAFGLLGVFCAARQLVRRLEDGGGRRKRRARWLPWLALGIAALSPLALAFSGTYFLETPFAAATAWALWAWLRREGPLGRELLAGALIAVAVFVKFNYGLLLGFGLFLDLLFEGVGRVRAGELKPWLLRVAALATPPLLSFAWWFGLPLPGDAALGAEHREAFLAFLSGNQQLERFPYDRRLWDAATYLAPSPAAFGLWLLGLALAARFALRSGGRAAWLLLLGSGAPIWLHNFHLDRFLVVHVVPLSLLVAAGWCALLPKNKLVAASVALALLFAPLIQAVPQADRFVAALGLVPSGDDDAAVGVRAYVSGLNAERQDLKPGKLLPTAGLARAAHDALLDAVAAEVRPGERIGWLGVNSEMSPGTLHLGLLARGAAPDGVRFQAPQVRPDGQPAMVVTFEAVDPGWDAGTLLGWASGFDVIFSTEPLDWKRRGGREFLGTYRGWLFENGAWTYASAGEFEVTRANGDVERIELFACRPVR